MPNIDGGHYFYTGLFPVNRKPVARADGSVTVPSHLLREALATLPNHSQTPGALRASPFARCRATHFARLAVIDDPAYEGRDGCDAILAAAKGVNLLAHQPIDYLARPWLLFAADFDGADAGARDRWARGLWQRLAPELRAVFGHCRSFDRVDSPDAFAAYLAKGQVETTMSFNDYWIDPLAAKELSLASIGLCILAVLALVLAGTWFAVRQWHLPWPIWIAAVLGGLAAGLGAAYALVNRRGAKPFPAAPDSDLKSVLKGLYLQQRFVRFAIAQQGASPAALHAAFGRFIAEVRPDDVEGPTQAPGVAQS